MRRSREAYRAGRVPARRCCRTSRRSTRRRPSSGRPAAAPLVFAPTGFTRMMHTEGEPAVARVAARAGIPYALSTMGTTSIERLAAAAPGRAAMVPALPVARPRGEPRPGRAGPRGRLRGAGPHRGHARLPGRGCATCATGSTIPPSLSLRTFAEGALHPAWWFDLLTTEPLEFASLSRFERHGRRAGRPDVRPGRDDGRPRLAAIGVGRTARRQGHPDRRRCPGGRRRRSGRRRRLQPRRTPARPGSHAAGGAARPSSTPSATAPRCTSTAASCPAATSSPRWRSARGPPWSGRAYLYGLMAGGERGVQRAADILREEVAARWRCSASRGSSDLRRDHVRLRDGLR